MKQSTTEKISCPGYGRDAHHCTPDDFYPSERSTGRSHFCRECHKRYGSIYFTTIYYPQHAEELKAAVQARRQAK
jgi:hypothetical protein